jgi:hypothetical protein
MISGPGAFLLRLLHVTASSMGAQLTGSASIWLPHGHFSNPKYLSFISCCWSPSALPRNPIGTSPFVDLFPLGDHN